MSLTVSGTITLPIDVEKLRKYIAGLYDTHGFSLGGDEVPFVEDETYLCQVCSRSFLGEAVMIVDNVGPVCMRCLHNLAEAALSG